MVLMVDDLFGRVADDDRESGELSGEAAPVDSNAISLSYSSGLPCSHTSSPLPQRAGLKCKRTRSAHAAAMHMLDRLYS